MTETVMSSTRYLLLYCAHMYTRDDIFVWIYPCERMEGIVCVCITLEELYNITMHLDLIIPKTSMN